MHEDAILGTNSGVVFGETSPFGPIRSYSPPAALSCAPRRGKTRSDRRFGHPAFAGRPPRGSGEGGHAPRGRALAWRPSPSASPVDRIRTFWRPAYDEALAGDFRHAIRRNADTEKTSFPECLGKLTHLSHSLHADVHPMQIHIGMHYRQRMGCTCFSRTAEALVVCK